MRRIKTGSDWDLDNLVTAASVSDKLIVMGSFYLGSDADRWRSISWSNRKQNTDQQWSPSFKGRQTHWLGIISATLVQKTVICSHTFHLNSKIMSSGRCTRFSPSVIREHICLLKRKVKYVEKNQNKEPICC